MRMKGEWDWRDLHRKTRYFFYLLVLPNPRKSQRKEKMKD